MSTLKVNAISDAAGANGNAITLATDGTCTAKVTNNLSNRNLILNGAFNVAQRSASSTSGGYASVDRFKVVDNNTNVTITQSQHALTSSDTGPWAKGFRKSWKQELSAAGNGLDGTTYLYLVHLIEGQDIANSGWDYTSASSYITLSFWFKASTNQTFYGRVMSNDGTTQNYPFSFTATGNDTWTKITKTIPGASNNQIDNDNGAGFKLEIALYAGADRTDSGVSLNTWAAYASGTRIPDMANTWITAGTSSFELTGVQLEVSDYATEFEHLSYGDELLKCQRYYENITGPSVTSTSASETLIGVAQAYTTARALANWTYKVQKRAYPSVSTDTASDVEVLVSGTGWRAAGSFGGNTNIYATRLDVDSVSSSPMTAGHCCEMRLISDGRIHMDAEL